MARKTDIPGRLVEAALALAAKRKWRDITLADIAAEGDLTLAQVLGAAGGKTEILSELARRIDAEVAKGTDLADLSQPARERLFDVMMRRFDAMAAHRDGIRGIVAGLRCDPVAAACAAPLALRSMAAMLECAGINSGGLVGLLRAKGLVAIYLATLKVWLDDDSEDLGPTMAALDKRLAGAERLMERLCPTPREPAAA